MGGAGGSAPGVVIGSVNGKLIYGESGGYVSIRSPPDSTRNAEVAFGAGVDTGSNPELATASK